MFPHSKIPSLDTLNRQINELVSKKNAAVTEYEEAKRASQEIYNIQQNAKKLYKDYMPKKQKRKEQEL